jgi:hypothetical protein
MKNRTLLWLAGGGLLLWYLMRKNRPAGGGAMPTGGGMAPAVLDALKKSEAIAEGVTFEIDTTTDRQVYAESQKLCR